MPIEEKKEHNRKEEEVIEAEVEAEALEEDVVVVKLNSMAQSIQDS